MDNRERPSTLYRGENCPCPSDCRRRGNCSECIQFHHSRHELTYCEYLYQEATAGDQAVPERAIPTGRQIRMLEYAPCAG